jgi:hypothetical protein
MRHWLSYSHSDQALLRAPGVDGCWEGLVVPGTLATFYFEGTGGFVLSRNRPYIIDPRTPLIQTHNVKRVAPKASHLALLEIHDPDPELSRLWPEQEISLRHWQQAGVWERTVDRVLEFQERYAQQATGKIDKYRALLAEARGEDPVEGVAPASPIRFVPPYWAVQNAGDDWWSLSRLAISRALARYEGGATLMPILAVVKDSPVATLADLIENLPEGCEQVFCWRGAWDEASATQTDVDGWVAAIDMGRRKGISITNLYGGYLSVLMTTLGLAGVSHGIGYSEQRDVRRLGQTGAPPTRYYIPALHAFDTVPNAQPIIDHLPAEWSCKCPDCKNVEQDGRPVVGRLKPEHRKRHFLYARDKEIRDVTNDLGTALAQLDEVADWLREHPLPTVIKASHRERLRVWAASIRAHLE